jgi:ABC-2 type transport system ATP-binding protein
MPPEERRRRADALIEMVGLGRDKKRQLKEYSKGMTRRIGVAQALINDPELVLLDEPTSGLDPIGTREMKDLIIDLKRRGKTVIMSSHLLADVEDVCDRIAVLHQGELKELGRVEDLLRVTDVTQIRARNLSPAARDEVQAVLARHGAADIEIGNPTTTLEDLFLEVVRDTEARPGRRARQPRGEAAAADRPAER